jgi:hypothetical protein
LEKTSKLNVVCSKKKNLALRRTMMKKLIMLALVCGIASLASAYVVTAPEKVNPGEAFSIVISGADNEVLYGGIYGDIDAIVATKVGNAGNLSGATHYPDFLGWDFIVDGTNLGTDNRPKAGNWWQFDYVAGAAGTVHSFGIFDYNQSYTDAVQTVAVTVIPEPATMALLGLGALVLRRKK